MQNIFSFAQFSQGSTTDRSEMADTFWAFGNCTAPKNGHLHFGPISGPFLPLSGQDHYWTGNIEMAFIYKNLNTANGKLVHWWGWPSVKPSTRVPVFLWPAQPSKRWGQVQAPGPFDKIAIAQTWHSGRRKSSLCSAAPWGMSLETLPRENKIYLNVNTAADMSISGWANLCNQRNVTWYAWSCHQPKSYMQAMNYNYKGTISILRNLPKTSAQQKNSSEWRTVASYCLC